jgi:hypothetical protein
MVVQRITAVGQRERQPDVYHEGWVPKAVSTFGLKRIISWSGGPHAVGTWEADDLSSLALDRTNKFTCVGITK